jgi:transcriptional regulator with XRE-family HTH domain
MAIPAVNSLDAISARLRLIRLAYSTLQKSDPPISQSAFARLCGIGVSAWNNLETGDSRIGIDNAMALARRTGASLDYIYFGDPRGLPHALAIEIERLEKQKAAKRA